jgi:hypothetical protein
MRALRFWILTALCTVLALPAVAQPAAPESVCADYQQALEDQSLSFKDFIVELGQAKGLYSSFKLSGEGVGLLGSGVYHAPEGGRFHLTLEYYNADEQVKTLTHILLVNEQQVAMVLGEQENLTIQQELPPDTLVVSELSFDLPTDASGVYHLILLRVRSADEPMGFSSAGLTLVIGEIDSVRAAPIPEFLPVEALPLPAPSYFELLWPKLSTTENPFVLPSGDISDLSVLVGYSGNTIANGQHDNIASTFALVAFIDGVQQRLGDNTMALYHRIDAAGINSEIPLRLSVPEDGAVHHLLIARIDHPRVLRCDFVTPDVILNRDAMYYQFNVVAYPTS